MPSTVPAMRAARQQHGEVSFHALNDVQVPVALISMLLLPVILIAARGEYGDLRQLAATVIVALLANAVVCGALSNPHDRYGARLADRDLRRRAGADAICGDEAVGDGDGGGGGMT